ncbi:hypothetical protein ALC62_13420, partial [Cyphomyrmex costatus]
GTSYGESATRGDREQVGERKESRRNSFGWKDDERATRSTQIARTVVFFEYLVCTDCTEHVAIALRDTRATTVRRKCFDKIYFTSQKNITCEFIALGRQLLWCRWPGNV